MTQPDLPDWHRTISFADAPFTLIPQTSFLPLPITSSIFDATSFNSLIVNITVNSPNINNVSKLQVNWFDNGSVVDFDNITFWGSSVANANTPILRIILPCKGAQFIMSIVSTGVLETYQFSVVGSRRVVPTALMKCDVLAVNPAVLALNADPIGIGATNTYRVGPSHGPLDWGFTQAGAFTLIAFAQIISAGTLVEPRLISVTGASNIFAANPVFAPGLALRVTVQNTSGAAATINGHIIPLAA